MSAVPLPAPENPENGDAHPGNGADDGWVVLEGLRRRLDDQALQGRATQQQVTQLTESIAALVEIQRRRTRGINLNSFIAYLIFTALCFTAFYLLYQSRASELEDTRATAIGERDAAIKRADDLAAKLAARETTDARAAREAAAVHAKESRAQEIEGALKAATASFKAGHYADVIVPLEGILASDPKSPHAAAMKYFLGIAYAKTDKLDKAVAYLQAAIDTGVEHDDARFQLASAEDRFGQYAKARIEYDKFATQFPQSQFAVYALRRSATIARMPPPDGNGPALPVVPRPAPVPVQKPAPVVEPSGDAGSAAQ